MATAAKIPWGSEFGCGDDLTSSSRTTYGPSRQGYSLLGVIIGIIFHTHMAKIIFSRKPVEICPLHRNSDERPNLLLFAILTVTAG